jgi:ABC-2 type transport system permease protein
LPKLVLPESLSSLLLVSLMCGWCAVSYGILIGVFAKTIEQAIGFGAVSVVILAAIGGIVVPSFAMPESLNLLMKISPLHWCMEAYNTLFLEGGYLKGVLHSLLPILAIIVAMQLVAVAGLKKQRLI